MNLLDENEAGFRKGLSNADATHIFIHIQKDSMILPNAQDEQSQPRENSEQPQGYLFYLKKAYPILRQANLDCGIS